MSTGSIVQSLKSKRRYNIKLWKCFTNCFNCLPAAAIVADKIFCCHAGLSPELRNIEQIRRIQRPTDVPDYGLLCDLLWSDPDESVKNWNENDAAVSVAFGVNGVNQFLDQNNLDLICRSHQVVENGYEFFANRRLVTIFSVPDHLDEFDNAGALMSVDQNLTCSFTVFPSRKQQADKPGDDKLQLNYPSQPVNQHMTSSLVTRIDDGQKCVTWADKNDIVQCKGPDALHKER